MINAFVDEHLGQFGVEPICKVLQFAPSAYRRPAARQRDPALISRRAQRDSELKRHVRRVWDNNMEPAIAVNLRTWASVTVLKPSELQNCAARRH